MNHLILMLSLLLGGQEQVPVRAGPLVLSGLDSRANELLRAELERRTGGVLWRIEMLDEERLLDELARPTVGSACAVVGYPTALLAEASVRNLLEPFDWTGSHGPLDDPDGRFRTCFYDPLVFVHGEASYAGVRSGSVPPAWLPEKIEELCRAPFQEKLRLEIARPWNATGVLIAALDRSEGSQKAVDRLLEGLDANVVKPYLVSDVVLLRRIEGGLEELGVTTLSAVRRWRELNGDVVRHTDPLGDPIGLLLGAGAVRGRGDPARPLLRALEDANVVGTLAVAEQLVPVVKEVPASDLPSWAESHRILLAANDVVIAELQIRSESAVRRFRDDLVGSMARREALFTEYFDTIGIVLMAVFVVWILRPGGRSRAGPES